MPDIPITATEAFKLHSRPSAKKKIFLDFDGHTVKGTKWNTQFKKTTYVTALYDKVCPCHRLCCMTAMTWLSVPSHCHGC